MDKPPLSISGLAQPSAPELPVSEHTPRQIGGAGSIPLPPNRSPSSLSAAVSGPFRSLIAQKEKELHDINEYRLQTIEETLRKREASEAAIRKKFNDLKADFVFNLRLIEERDRELDKYESTCEKLKAYVREREKEIAQLRLERTNMSSKLGRRDDEAARREVEFQQEIKALSSQIESMRWESEQASSTHASRIVALESQFEQEKREHAKTLSVHEESLRAESKRAIEAADARMDAALASHDRQKRELERRVLELQTLMSKEAERASAQARVVEELRESKTKAESHAKKVNWELSDKIEAKEREVQELISEQKELKEKNKTVLDNYEKQMTELLSSLHTVESAFREQREQYELQLRQQASSREEELRRVGHRLRSQLESAEDQAKLANRARDELKQQLAKREQQEAERIRDLQRELEASKASSSVEIEKLQQELRDSNAKLWSAQSEVKHAQDSSATQREAVERYKAEAKSARDEVQRGLSREGELKREMAALNANWQQRWEKDRAAMTERHNNLTSVLQKQRDHLEGEVRKLEDRASELEEQLHVSRDSTRLARAEVRTREVEIEKMKGEAEKREREQAEEEAERRAGERNRAEQKHLRRETEDAGRSLSPKMAEDSKFEPFATQVDDDDEILAPASPLRPLALGLDDYLDGPARSASDEKLVQENSKLRAAVSVMAREMEEIRAKDRLAAIAAVNAGNAAGGSVHISRRGSVDINLGQDDGGVIDTASGMNEGSSSPLAEKLKDAENDVEKLIEERERLMEVSNRVSDCFCVLFKTSVFMHVTNQVLFHFKMAKR